VWEALKLFDDNPKKTALLFEDDVISSRDLESYKAACIRLWSAEQVERIIPKIRDICHGSIKLHGNCGDKATDIDEARWQRIDALRRELAQDSLSKQSLLSELEKAFKDREYDRASALQLSVSEAAAELEALYLEYKRNLF